MTCVPIIMNSPLKLIALYSNNSVITSQLSAIDFVDCWCHFFGCFGAQQPLFLMASNMKSYSLENKKEVIDWTIAEDEGIPTHTTNSSSPSCKESRDFQRDFENDLLKFKEMICWISPQIVHLVLACLLESQKSYQI